MGQDSFLLSAQIQRVIGTVLIVQMGLHQLLALTQNGMPVAHKPQATMEHTHLAVDLHWGQPLQQLQTFHQQVIFS